MNEFDLTITELEDENATIKESEVEEPASNKKVRKRKVKDTDNDTNLADTEIGKDNISQIEENSVLECEIEDIDSEKINTKVEESIGGIKRGVERASKNNAKSLYKKEEIFKLERTNTEETTLAGQRKQEFERLAAAQARGGVLKATITGARMLGGDTYSYPAVIANYGNSFNVIVLASHLFETPAFVETSDSPKDALLSLCNMRIGLEIDFVPYNVDEINRVAYGNVMLANAAKARYFFMPKDDKEPLIKEGMIVESIITSVSSEGVGLHIFGAETYVRKNELSHLFRYSLREEYKVGDVVNARIMKIEPKIQTVMGINNKPKKIKTVGVVASVKSAEKDLTAFFFDDFNIGDVVLAEVTHMTTTGIFVNLKERANALCPFPRDGALPIVGSKVLVQINEKNDTDKRIYGIVKRII